MQNAATTIPESPNRLMDNVGLHVNRMWIPENIPVRQKTFWDVIKELVENGRNSLKAKERPFKGIGTWEFAHGKSPRVVEHGGNMS